AAADHLEPVLDNAALVARTRDHGPPAGLRPGDDGDQAAREVGHDMAIALQRMGIGDHERHAVDANLARGDRRRRAEVDFGEIRKHGGIPLPRLDRAGASACEGEAKKGNSPPLARPLRNSNPSSSPRSREALAKPTTRGSISRRRIPRIAWEMG